MYKKYSSVENSAYGFERVLAFVTVHPWEIVNGQLTNESARFDFCYVINVFICMIFRPNRVPGLLRFHQFTCCLLAEIHFARYEQTEFQKSNRINFPVWRLSFCTCFFDNIILSDCFTVTGEKQFSFINKCRTRFFFPYLCFQHTGAILMNRYS